MKKYQILNIKNQNDNVKFKNFAFLIFILIFDFCILNSLLTHIVFAEEVTILYTGNTHGMIYHCNCPIEPDGGAARRATLVKELRGKYPGALLLDSGNFFAGGAQDNYSQNAQLDKARSLINLRAMGLMKYDAVALGEEEFNFGGDFLQEGLAASSLTFLSSNFKQGKALPYLIKEAGGVKFGIIGLTNSAARLKGAGLEFGEPKAALTAQIAELKKQGVEITLLLTSLAEDDARDLINNVSGVDIVLAGRSQHNAAPAQKIPSGAIILRPSWQGRRLGKATLILKDKKIIEHKSEEIRLSDKIAGDQEVLKIMPQCFSDDNCQKTGFLGACANPGKADAQCRFRQAEKVNLTVVSSRSCISCDPQPLVNYLKRNIPGLVVAYEYYPESRQAQALVRDLKVEALPAYFLGSEVEKEAGFRELQQGLEKAGRYYAVKPSFAGVAYFLKRNKLKGRVDLFASLFGRESAELLEAARDLNPELHFLVTERQPDSFEAAAGNLEVEEDKRALCVQKYFPRSFWNYITCRARSINSSWWKDCAAGLDTAKISACARGPEANLLLRENSALNKELRVMFGPVYLVENQEIFSTQGRVTKEELKKVLAR